MSRTGSWFKLSLFFSQLPFLSTTIEQFLFSLFITDINQHFCGDLTYSGNISTELHFQVFQLLSWPRYLKTHCYFRVLTRTFHQVLYSSGAVNTTYVQFLLLYTSTSTWILYFLLKDVIHFLFSKCIKIKCLQIKHD